MYYILYEGLKIESNEPVYCICNIINNFYIPLLAVVSLTYV